MLLRARGKERVEPRIYRRVGTTPDRSIGKALIEPLGKANTHALRPHLRGQGSLEKE